jgi:hypothetical protein
MKKNLQFFLTLIFIMTLTTVLSGQKAEFNGSWKLDRTKAGPAGELPLLVNLRITIKGDTLKTTRSYELNDGQQYPFEEQVIIGGKEVEIYIYDMPRKIKANWLENGAALNFISTTTFYGDSGSQNFVSDETWKVDKASGTLTISSVNRTPAGEFNAAFVFTR